MYAYIIHRAHLRLNLQRNVHMDKQECLIRYNVLTPSQGLRIG